MFVECSLFQFILKRTFILLSLTRKPDESIIIETSDGNIVVSVVAIKANQVKLKFQAPDNIDIWREEIYEILPNQVGMFGVNSSDGHPVESI